MREVKILSSGKLARGFILKRKNLQPFRHKNGQLCCEEVPAAEIADRIGTPFYLYSQTSLEHEFRAFDSAFDPLPHLTCYAVKANSNLAILSLFRSLGAGFDVVSGGELLRALAVGMQPKKIVFSGVGKAQEELDLGLRRGILQFNIESAAELRMLEGRAQALGISADIGLRLNPDIDARTHPYISTGASEHKFGIPVEEALHICRHIQNSRRLRITGIGCHIGSQITTIEPFIAALSRLREIVLDLRTAGIRIRHLDLGGGLGITYNDEKPPHPVEYAREVTARTRDLDCILIFEPGRVIVGNAGILVTKVLLTKRSRNKNFVVVDAGMSDLMRPSLYGAYHGIRTVKRARRQTWKTDIVGPICESGDFLARDREIPIVRANELLAVMSAGAYGYVLSSNYNTRARPAEVLVRQQRFKVIRRRERFQDLIRGEARRPL